MRSNLLIVFVLSFSTILPAQGRPLSASMIELIASPARYDGKLVSVIGYLAFEREKRHGQNVTLNLHKEDAENLLSNALPVIQSEEMLRNKEKLDRMYVELVAVARVVHADGQDDILVLTDVRLCRVWSDPNRPLRP